MAIIRRLVGVIFSDDKHNWPKRKSRGKTQIGIGIAESQHESNLSSLKRRNFTEIQSAFQSTGF